MPRSWSKALSRLPRSNDPQAKAPLKRKPSATTFIAGKRMSMLWSTRDIPHDASASPALHPLSSQTPHDYGLGNAVPPLSTRNELCTHTSIRNQLVIRTPWLPYAMHAC
jgi:hypothetical protein